MPNRAIANFPVFAGFIQDRTKDFTGREWVFTEIDRWLADPDGPTFFIITGEPGVGKSAIAARLTQVRDLAAYHFCIARNLPTTDPLRFVRSISLQLADCYQPFAQALANLEHPQISVQSTQQITTVERGAEVKGIVIENLQLGSLSAQVAFVHAVLQPLQALEKNGSEIVILVDALDEAVQRKDSETIVNLLANAGDLPRQVRFVLTSRPEGAALRHFEERQIPHFLLDAGRPENLEDIRRYVRGQLATSTTLRDRVADQHMDEATFVERITTASQGNFLYVVWLLRAIGAGTQRFDVLETQPQGLDGIYHELLLTRTVGEDWLNWRVLYRPILGSLVAAFEPLTAKQIEQFTDLSSQDVADGLQDLGQFLDPNSADKGRYRLYHKGINDWLQDRDRSWEFWIEVTRYHMNIVEYYLHLLGV